MVSLLRAVAHARVEDSIATRNRIIRLIGMRTFTASGKRRGWLMECKGLDADAEASKERSGAGEKPADRGVSATCRYRNHAGSGAANSFLTARISEDLRSQWGLSMGPKWGRLRAEGF